MTTLDRWHSAWQEAGASHPDDITFHRILTCYSEPHRKYHTVQHLRECFAHLEQLRSIADRPVEVELALWFHDAIYNTSRKDNEIRSARWARDTALSSDLPMETAERIYDLVLVTKHNESPVGGDAEVLVDVDLGILGSEPNRFDEYEDQIREEYSWVPRPLYRIERRKILQGFGNRQFIYYTTRFRELYEAQARDNIARSLTRL